MFQPDKADVKIRLGAYKKCSVFYSIGRKGIVKPKSEVPKSKVPKSRPKGLGLTLKSHGAIIDMREITSDADQ